MTNKINGIDVSEEIIIDGVNVVGCEHSYVVSHKPYCGADCEYIYNACDNYPDCYFKQFKRLQKENEKLQMLSCANCGEKYLSPDGAELYEKNVQLQQENEKLKEARGRCAFKCLDNTFCDEAKFKIDKLELDKDCLNVSLETARKYRGIAEVDRDKYKQALEEIRNAITESVPKKQGDYNFSKSLNPDKYALLEYIQNKINEVLNEQ